MAEHQVTHNSEEAGHELSDLNAGPVIIFAASTAILIVVSILIVIGMLGAFDARTLQEELPPVADTQQLPATGPRLQANPELDLVNLQAADEAVLSSYGWVDEDNEIVRIPIEEAKELLLEQGLPTR